MIASVDFRGLLETLGRGRVDFIVIGGVAAVVHGSARATFDLDVVYSRAPANLQRLVDALTPLKALSARRPAGPAIRLRRGDRCSRFELHPRHDARRSRRSSCFSATPEVKWPLDWSRDGRYVIYSTWSEKTLGDLWAVGTGRIGRHLQSCRTGSTRARDSSLPAAAGWLHLRRVRPRRGLPADVSGAGR